MAVETFKPLTSEHVDLVMYDPSTQRLRVRFRNKTNKNARPRSYTHQGVPASVYAAMTQQLSVGRYYHNVIKQHYKQVV